MKHYDLIVIGSGIASVPARKCVKEGWSVALIDELPPGGTCALRGCTPKKLLRSGAEIIDLVKRMDGHGISVDNINGVWADMIDHKNDYTDPIPVNNKKNYDSQGIDFYQARAEFINESEIKLINTDEENVLSAKKFVIATGARPSDLPFPGAELLISSDDFLNLPALPKSIVFAGGGFISMEYAHIASRFDVETHVIQRRELPLKSFDPDLVKLLVEIGKEHAGVNFHAHTQIDSVERDGDQYLVKTSNTLTGETHTIKTDLVVHGAGRIANVDKMNLEAAGVDYSHHGVTVNSHLQSVSNPNVYAAGDAAASGAPQLSFTASREGLAVSDNLLNGNQTEVNYKGQASIVFTLPAMACAGLLESEAKDAGYDVEVRYAETARWFTNRRLKEGAGAYKIIIDKATDQILGAHFLAHHCEEFINVFALAIHHKMTRADLKKVLWAHPSSASDLSRIIG